MYLIKLSKQAEKDKKSVRGTGLDKKTKEVYSDSVIENGIEYDGIVKVARMWTHYDGIR